MRKIIDFHAHVFPDKIADKATDNIGKFYDRKMNESGCVSKLLNHSEKNGISHFVIQSVATTAAQVVSINDFIAKTVKTNPNVLTGFGTIHPDFEDIEGEIDRMVEIGMKGVKLHPDFQKFNIDDEKALKIYDVIEGRLPLLIHMGDYRFDYSHPRRLVNVLKTFPKLDVVAAHFGGWSVFEDAFNYLYDMRCWVDSSSTFPFLDDQNYARELVNRWGSERILFGTDFPMADYDLELELFFAACADMNDQQLDAILYKNAEKLIGEV